MSATILSGMLASSLAEVLGEETRAGLQAVLETAETEIEAQVASIPVDPVLTDPATIKAQEGAIRSEVISSAVISFLASMAPQVGQKIGETVKEYLDAHAEAAYIPGSLAAGQFPVMVVPGVVKATKIIYT